MSHVTENHRHKRVRLSCTGELDYAVPTNGTRPRVHVLGILMARSGRFLWCTICQLRIAFPFGDEYKIVSKQFEARPCFPAEPTLGEDAPEPFQY